MVIKNHPNLIELINRLNDGATISGSLVHSLLGPAWDLIDVFSFLQELFSKDAIEIDNWLKVLRGHINQIALFLNQYF